MKGKLGLSIFNSTWHIEPQVGLNMLDHWMETRNQEGAWSYNDASGRDKDKTDYAAYKKMFAISGNVIAAPNNSYDLKWNFEGFNGASVAIIHIDGPLMKSDYCGSLGTVSIGNLVKMANNTSSVKSIIFVVDSPGGQTTGIQTLANIIKGCSKETVAFVDGYLCSAAYWLATACNKIIAANGSSIIGSIGTMISFYDSTKAMEERGYVLREYYATESTEKNAAFIAAAKGDGKKIIMELLDPINDEFIGFITTERPALNDHKKEVLTGKTFVATTALTLALIDSISSLDDVIESASTSFSKNKNKISMNVFQCVLAAANATEFPIVEGKGKDGQGGGFLLSEDNLKGIEAELSKNAEAAATVAQNTTTIKALTSTITALEASKITPEQLSAEQDKVKDLTSKLSAAEGAKTEAEKAKADAVAALALEKKKPGANFGATQKDKDESASLDNEETVDLDTLAHNKTADDLGYGA